MPLEPSDLQRLNASQGYAALGMYEDANAELEEVDPFCKTLPEVLAVRLEIYRGTAKWDLMQVVAEKLAKSDHREPQWAISAAYATRRAVSIEAAKQILLEAMKRFPQEPVIHYNVACYDCQLGLIEAAKKHLHRALELDPRWRLIALDDDDLRPLWESL